MFLFFFFNDTATTEIYTLSLHDALPICTCSNSIFLGRLASLARSRTVCVTSARSEEHTSELQSHSDLVCRLLLEKKKKHRIMYRLDYRTDVSNIDLKQLISILLFAKLIV